MAGPTKPIESYPAVDATERPPLPPVDPAAGDGPAQADTAPPAPAAVLDFVGEGRSRTVPLDHPFRLDGGLVSAIEVRRLTIDQVTALVKKNAHEDLQEVYAAMTGLPAAVLRGLDADDGIAVSEVAFDFLPRLIRKAHGSS